MKKRNITPTDFDKLLTALSSELVEASIYLKLNNDLISEKQEYIKEFREANTFWWLTFNALRETALGRLCRVYERHPDSNNLPNLLDIIRINFGMFQTDEFKARLKDNPHIESLAESHEAPKIDQLNADIDYASDKKNPLVKKLIQWRNNLIAHKNAKNVIKEINLHEKFPLSNDDILELIDKGLSIVNHYSVKFRASSYSSLIVGHDDYKYVLKCIRNEGIRHEEEIEAQLKKYGVK